MGRVLVERTVICEECGWKGRWEDLILESETGDIMDSKLVCPACGSANYDELLVDYGGDDEVGGQGRLC